MHIADVRTIPLSYRCETPYMVASLRLLASLPNGLMLEFDQNPNALRQRLLKEPISAAAGYVKLPKRSGLGVEFDPMTVERYRVQ